MEGREAREVADTVDDEHAGCHVPESEIRQVWHELPRWSQWLPMVVKGYEAGDLSSRAW